MKYNIILALSDDNLCVVALHLHKQFNLLLRITYKHIYALFNCIQELIPLGTEEITQLKTHEICSVCIAYKN